MESADSASAPLGPSFAPEDPTLPKPWTGLIDGSTGVLYYWNPETNVTQYERPASATPPLPLGPPPSAPTPNVAPNTAGHSLPPNGNLQHQQQQQQPPTQQAQPSQQLHHHLPSQQIQPQHAQQMVYNQTQMQNQQYPQQIQHMQYPQTQFSYIHAQQIMPQQGLQSQGLQVSYQEAQHVQGLSNQRQQGPQPQQDTQQQSPQVPYQQAHQPMRVAMPHLQGQHSQGAQGASQQGQQQEPQPRGQNLGSQQGRQTKFPKVEDTVFQEGKQPGFSSPSIQSPMVPGSSPRIQVPYAGAHPMHPLQQHGGPSSTSLQQHFSPSAPLRHDGVESFHQQQRMGGPIILNAMDDTMARPPMGPKLNFEDDNRSRVREEFDVSRALPEHPKLAPLPFARTQQDMPRGPMNPSFMPPTHGGGSNMFPRPAVPHSYGNAPSTNISGAPNMGPVRPPLRMFGQPDFPHLSADAYRQHHEVTAMGDNVPAPFMTFEATGFPPEILREMHFAGFSSPTPIQAQTWPVALQGRDIVAIAKTGSGKTLGYLIPAFIHLKRCRNNPQNGPTVLVLAPTRELATQIQDEALKFGRSSTISCTCLYGGAQKGPQLKELERGADIVVATPGRLNDILEMRKISLRQVSFLVLDEADRMLDMGFEPQIRGVVNEVPPRRQTLMYTATWPKEVRKIAGDLLVNPVQVNIGSVDELAANKSITQYVEVVPQMDKQRRLEQILRAQERGSKIIIFCSTKRLCDQLARGIGRSFGAAAIHGDKSQDERDRVLNDFRTGRAPILVATDVAARGLDIKDIRVVINYDFPTGIEDYVHRIGRTGRAGATGVAYTFFCDQDWKYAADLIKVLEGANQQVPPEIREMAARGAPVYPRGGENPVVNRWDSGAARWDSGGGRGMISSRGMMRDGGRGRGMMRDGGGGRGIMRDGPGGFNGGRGGGRSDFNGGGRGGRVGRGFGGSGGPFGRGRHDRGGPYDRYNNQDGRGRYANRRPSGDRGRERSYSRSPERGRSWGRSRSRSSSRSRSRSRSWSRSRSSSRSRSRSPSYERYERRRVRVSGFDVRPPIPNESVPPPSAPESAAVGPSSGASPEFKENAAGVVSVFDGQMSPMSPGNGNSSFPVSNDFHKQLPINPMDPNHQASGL